MQLEKDNIELAPSLSIFDNDTCVGVIANGKDFEYETSKQEFTFKFYSPSNLLILDPRPSEGDMSKIYPSNYLPYQFDTLPTFVVYCRNLVQRRKVKVYEKLVSNSKGKVLDLGCGNGQLLLLLKKFGPTHWDLWGSDFNDAAKPVLAEQGIHFITGDICEFAGKEKFNLIILNQVIEHLPDVRKVLHKLYEILEVDGKIVLETPSSEGLDAYIFRKRYWGGYHFPRHFYIFNESNLTSLVQNVGFDLHSVNYLASPSFWIQSLHHLCKEALSSKLANFFSASNIVLLSIFTLFDILISTFGGKTSNMRLVAVKKVQD